MTTAISELGGFGHSHTYCGQLLIELLQRTPPKNHLETTNGSEGGSSSIINSICKMPLLGELHWLWSGYNFSQWLFLLETYMAQNLDISETKVAVH